MKAQALRIVSQEPWITQLLAQFKDPAFGFLVMKKKMTMKKKMNMEMKPM